MISSFFLMGLLMNNEHRVRILSLWGICLGCVAVRKPKPQSPLITAVLNDANLKKKSQNCICYIYLNCPITNVKYLHLINYARWTSTSVSLS